MAYTAGPIPSPRGARRVRERGAREIRDHFRPMFSRLSPLPGPLPARPSRGEGEDEAVPVLRAFVAYPADSLIGCSIRQENSEDAVFHSVKVSFRLSAIDESQMPPTLQ